MSIGVISDYRSSKIGILLLKAKIHYTSFPVASPQQVCNKLAEAKVRCVCCVVCRFPNSITASDLLPSWQLSRPRGSYGETGVLKYYSVWFFCLY